VRSNTKEKYPPNCRKKPVLADLFGGIGSGDEAKEEVAHWIFSL